MDGNTAARHSARRTRSVVAVACVLLTLVGPSRTVLAQPSGSSVGPGTRVRIAISSALTPADLKAMAGADSGVPHVETTDRTIVLNARTDHELVLPAPGSTFAGVVLAVDNLVVSIKADHLSSSLTVPRARSEERRVGKECRL